MKKILALLILTDLLVACDLPQDDAGQGATPPAEFPLFGAGYRGEGDQCRRVGESGFTNQFLDDAADLVACPPESDSGLFASQTGGREVGRLKGWILLSVPRR